MIKTLFSKITVILKDRNTIAAIIASMLAALFVYTGINKLWDHSLFTSQLNRSPFIHSFVGFLSYTLPIGELAVVLALAISRTRSLGLYLSYFLMLSFTGYIWLMLNYAYDLPCSCGGILSAMTWKDHLVFNTAFTVLAAVGILLNTRTINPSTSNNKNISAK